MGPRRYSGGRQNAWSPLVRTREHRWNAQDGGLSRARSCALSVNSAGASDTCGVTACGPTAITTAIEKGQQAGVGLDQIRHFSRHKTLATTLIYRDEHEKAATQKTLADVVAGTLATNVSGSEGAS
jgi:hypothetical protein